MSLSLYIVDAFTSVPCRGNPAGVCLLDGPQPETWMQAVAREMNLSETAFVRREGDAFRLRWFTPTVEVDLCGHATLAAAHVLWETGTLAGHEAARFDTLSGRLTCMLRQSDTSGRWIEMDFPAEPPEPCAETDALLAALGVTSLAAAPQKNRLDYLVELESEEAVQQVKPHLSVIAALPARAVIVTARASDSRYAFVSRFFGPAVGVPEDPVTGSAHCALGPYWAKKLGQRELTGYQASARGGVVKVRVNGDRVALSGQAVTVVRGEWSAPLAPDMRPIA